MNHSLGLAYTPGGTQVSTYIARIPTVYAVGEGLYHKIKLIASAFFVVDGKAEMRYYIGRIGGQNERGTDTFEGIVLFDGCLIDQRRESIPLRGHRP